MIYPTLNLTFQGAFVELYDTEFSADPILHVKGDKDKSAKMFFILLKAFCRQYDNGYDDGWTDAEEMLQEEQDYDC